MAEENRRSILYFFARILTGGVSPTLRHRTRGIGTSDVRYQKKHVIVFVPYQKELVDLAMVKNPAGFRHAQHLANALRAELDGWWPVSLVLFPGTVHRNLESIGIIAVMYAEGPRLRIRWDPLKTQWPDGTIIAVIKK